MITLTHTFEQGLPRTVRTYIDSCSSEFKEIDDWTKIAHIAYRVKRGINLLPDFIEDIKRHMEHPAYGDYEDTAKYSIATYIDLLRTGEKCYLVVNFLSDKMSFPALFQLLTEEILYRYWETEINYDEVECHFDEVHWDYDEVARRFKDQNPDTFARAFRRYISTSRETLRNIEVDEDSIRRKNGWSTLAKDLYGYTVWSDKTEDERIYPGDATFIHEFNKKVGPKYQYIVGVPPMPFSGNLLSSKVVLLTLNPGYVEKVNKDKCMALPAAEKEQLLCLMRNALNFCGKGIYDGYDCSRKQGDYYWERAFSHLAMEAYGKPSKEECHPIYEDIAFLQLVGYHSEKFRYSAKIKNMPSMIFTNLLVKHLATKTDKTFLCLRSETLWTEVFGEELWNRLESEGRIITKGHKGMSQAITRGNLKKDNGFERLVNILKQ